MLSVTPPASPPDTEKDDRIKQLISNILYKNIVTGEEDVEGQIMQEEM